MRALDRCFLLFASLSLSIGAAAVTCASSEAHVTRSHPRIVSMNPCVDAVLVRVADPAQVAGISHYSQDPRATSIPLEVANRFRATSGTAEEIYALAPDRVLAGPHVSPSTIQVLERMKVPLTKFDVAESIGESREQIRAIAQIVGYPERGEQLIADIDAAVARARPGKNVTIHALIWQSGGLVPGGGTLADELLRHAGFRNLSAEYGLQQWDILPLEHLLASPPEVLLATGAGQGGRRDRTVGHPVLRKLSAQIAIRPYPFRLLSCAGPAIIEALDTLATIHAEVVATKGAAAKDTAMTRPVTKREAAKASARPASYAAGATRLSREAR